MSETATKPMSIAASFRNMWGIIAEAADRSRGQNADARYAAMFEAANKAQLCSEHHTNGVERAGTKNELKWFSDRGIDALELAAALWAASPNPHAMYRVLMAHKNAESNS